MDNVIRETGEIVNDGLERIFVNTEIKDGTDISELMTCFLQTNVDNPKFPIFSNRMKFLKCEEGGLNAVCEVMERYEKIAVQEAMRKAQIEKEQALKEAQIEKEQALKEAQIEKEQAVDAAKAEAKAEAEYRAKVEAIKTMINRFHAEKEQILEIYTAEEYNQAIKEFKEN